MLTMLSPLRRALGVALPLLLAATFLFPLVALADAPDPADFAALKAALWRDGAPRDLPVEGAPLAGAGAVSAASAAPDDTSALPVSAWSRIAFYSYRDGNAEIYAANGDGTGVVRLTDHPEPDLNPRLSPDNSRVVFVSKRDGNYELYTVGLDGSHLRRLTDTSATETEPAWSPDGRQIVFSSNRSGVWGIYVMDADGANQRPITGGFDDGAPAWSPDGSRIAFLRYKNNAGEADIWVIATDGASGGAVASTYRYAQHLVWSPDGGSLALDCDSDYDYFNEIMTLALNSGYMPTVYNPYPPAGYELEARVGAWSPDAERIIFALATYARDPVTYLPALVGGRLGHIRPTGVDNDVVFLPGSSGLDFGPSWVSADRQPPVTALAPAPAYAPAAGVALSWGGADTGDAGLLSYDVEARVDGGPWQVWAKGVVTTTGVYQGQGGRTVDFRVRGRDRAFNVEAWRATPDATVRLYATTVEGRVRDARGYPVEGAMVSASPAAMAVMPEGGGAYRAYLAGTNTVTLNAAHPLYGPTGSATRSGVGPHRADFTLPGKANVVAGGGFDGAALDPAWRLGGDARPQRVDAAGQFGTGAVALGQPFDLTAPEQIASEGYGRLIARDDTQALLTSPPSGSGMGLDLRWRTVGGAWSEIKRAPIGASLYAFGYNINAALDPALNLHVVWAGAAPPAGDPALYSCVIPHGGSDCAVSLVSGTEGIRGFRLALDADGGAHVSGHDDRGRNLFADRGPDGVWTTQREEDQTLQSATSVIRDAQGGLHVAWSDWPQYAPTTITMYRYRRPDGAWQAPEIVAGGGSQWSQPRLAQTPDGALHIVWQDLNYDPARWGLYYASKRPDGGWSPSVRITSSIEVALFGAGARGPELYVEQGASLHRFAMSAGGQWREAQAWPLGERVVDQGTLDNRGRAHFITRINTSWPQLVFLQSSTSAEQGTRSVLSQDVTIPADSHAPTLSFFMQADSAADGRLRVMVTDGGAEQPLMLHVAGDDGGQRAWADLTPWAGKTVNLSFEVAADVGEPLGQVRLDEIAVAPWLTPVIEAVQVTPMIGEMTIRGRNFDGAAQIRADGQPLTTRLLDEGTLTAVLPRNFGQFTVQVVNPGGQTAQRLARAGYTRFLPMMTAGW